MPPPPTHETLAPGHPHRVPKQLIMATASSRLLFLSPGRKPPERHECDAELELDFSVSPGASSSLLKINPPLCS
ncbi:hypothetical protein LDENG_00132980 [Lucifuga dentata]|nr:hypothetical protein LDENG_00132980 [Lucifuga dentata]